MVQISSGAYVALTFEVADSEDIRTTFTSRRNDFRCVDFGETLIGKNVTEKTTDTGFEAENRLISRRSQIQHTVVEPSILIDADIQAVWVLLILGIEIVNKTVFSVRRYKIR